MMEKVNNLQLKFSRDNEILLNTRLHSNPSVLLIHT